MRHLETDLYFFIAAMPLIAVDPRWAVSALALASVVLLARSRVRAPGNRASLVP